MPTSPTLPSDYLLRPANPTDLAFLGHAILMAERDVHEYGLWDVLFGVGKPPLTKGSDVKEKEVEGMLSEVIRLSSVIADNREDSVDESSNDIEILKRCMYNLSNFTIIEHKPSSKPIACACSFPVPCFNLDDTVKSLVMVLKRMYKFSPEQCEEALARISWLDDIFPNNVEHDGLKFVNIESIYTDVEHRRLGLSKAIVNTVLERERERERKQKQIPEAKIKECRLNCSTTNTNALKGYEKLGFGIIGNKPDCKAAMDAMGTPGYYCLSVKIN